MKNDCMPSAHGKWLLMMWIAACGWTVGNATLSQPAVPSGVEDQIFHDRFEGEPTPPPQLLPIPDQVVAAGALFSYQLETVEPAHERVRYQLDDAPAGMTVGAQDGLINWVPGIDQQGKHPVVARADDPFSGFDQAAFQITVTSPDNLPPSLAPIADRSLRVGQSLELNPVATDPDLPADELAFTLDGAPAGLSLSSASGRMVWSPLETQAGQWPMVLTVTDLAGASDSQDFTVTVQRLGSPPVLAAMDDVQLVLGQSLALTAAADDPDLPEESLSFDLVTAPQGMTLESTTGALAWTPAGHQLGRHDISLRVVDSVGLVDHGHFVAEVLAPALAPVARDDEYRARRGETLTVEAPGVKDNDFHPDGRPLLAAELVSGPQRGVLDFRADGSFDYTPGPESSQFEAELVSDFRSLTINGASEEWRVNRGTVVAGDLTGNGRSELLAIGQRGSGIQNTQYLTALSFNEDDELELLWFWNGWLGANPVLDPDRDFAMISARDPVIGDLTGDGIPEVVVTGYCRGDILIFSNSGERLVSTQAGRVPPSGTSPECPALYGSTGTSGRGRLSLVDLTGNGLPDILLSFYNTLRAFDGSGNLLWEVQAPNYSPGTAEFDYAVADVNLDGQPNIWFGGALFDANGNVLWSKATNPSSGDWLGLYAVANLNDDPFAELIYWGLGPDLVVFNHQGQCLWQARKSPSANPNPTLGCPSAVQIPDLPALSPGFQRGLMVGDIAGDGVTRIVIGNRSNSDDELRNRVIAFNPDGTPFWSVPALLSSGASVGVNQINAFDFTGNGVMELVVTGVNGTVVLDGRNGSTLFEIPADDDNPGFGISAGYDMLYSIIVDLDGNGAAELVVSSQGSLGDATATGLFVYRHPQNLWMPARGIWNQWAYSVTNVNPDGTIPSPAAPNWQEPGLNNYRVNALPVAERVGLVRLAAFEQMVWKDVLQDVFPTPYTPQAQKLTVADLTGDGRPEILTTVHVFNADGFNPVLLVALAFDPDEGSLEPLWIVSNNVSFPEQADFAIGWTSRDPAVGDLTGDGVPEVVHPAYCRGGILVFSNLGEPIFSSVAGTVPDCPQTGGAGGSGGIGRISLVDLTGDGLPEILNYWGGNIFAYTRTGPQEWGLLWAVDAPNFTMSPGANDWDYVVADVNLDGRPNIYFGHSLLDADGTVLWSAPVSNMTNEFWHAVANLDDDPFGELLTLSHRVGLVARNHDGSCLWNARPGGSPISGCSVARPFPNGGLPARGLLVAALTGGAHPQIISLNGVKGSGDHFITVHEHDGNLRWQIPARMSDGTVNWGTAIQAFDLNGNGRMEVIVSGHAGTTVHDGNDGSLLFELRSDGNHPGGNNVHSYNNAVTIAIADMTGDGRGELLLASNGGFLLPADQRAYGIFIYSDVLRRSGAARGLWNQWSYSATNVNPDLSIPSPAARNWLTPGLNNYRINAVPPGEPGGFDAFSYRVSDGEQVSNEATVYLDIRRPNRPPQFTSLPVDRAGVGLPYRYRVGAFDPDPGDEVILSLDLAPSGMSLGNDGMLEWQPVTADLGQHPIILSARDLEGEITLQEFTLSVVEPVVVPDVVGLGQAAAEAELAAAGLTTGRLDQAHDPVAPPDQVMAQSPGAGGLQLPGTAVNLVVSIGPSPVAPNFPPDRPVEALVIEPDDLVLLQGQSRQLEAFAVLDDGSEHRLTDAVWSASGPLFVSAEGRVAATGAGLGTVTVEREGLMAEITVEAVARDHSDAEAPTASIAIPADGAQVSERIAVIGTADDANLVAFRLELALPDSGDWQLIGQGTAPVIADVLGHLDATLLENDLWQLRLRVLDAGGNESVDQISVVIDGDQKAGLFSLNFVDLDIPLAGVPIRIERVYDSRRRVRGELGPGWRLGVRSTELRCTAPIGAGWQVAKSGLSFVLLPNEEKLCTVRLADGRLERFDFRPAVSNSPFVPFSLLGSSFVPRPGTRGHLQVLGNTNLAIVDQQPGEVTLLDDNGFLLFNPRRFRYIGADGSETVLSLDTGVESFRDRNGHTLSFEADGIFHSSGQSVLFERDPLGRIIGLTDPAGHQQYYQYGNNGDLIAHVDAEGFETRYRYNRRHGLVTVIDPLNRPLIRNDYDADGRLVRMTTAEGRVIDLSHDLVARQQILTDTDGEQTIIQYDARGNVLQVVDPQGNITSHSYDQWDNQISTTTPDGRTTSRSFDQRGNLTSRTNSLGHTVSYNWSQDNLLTSRTDELGRTTSFDYDSRGNLIRVTGPDGQVEMEQAYDADGQLIARANALGETELLGYDANGRLNSFTDGRGHTWAIDYDSLGRPISEVDRRGIERSRAFDARGLITQSVDGEGGITAWDFDAAGQLSGLIDPLGGISVFSHDAEGRLVEQADPLGRVRQLEWTAQDYPARRIDPLGRVSETAYDTLGRPTTFEQPDGSVHAVSYDADGHIVSRTDARGHTTVFAWDDAGRLIGQTDPLGHSVSFAYDAAGNRLSQTDARGRVTSYGRDVRNRLISITYPDGAVESKTWDGADRLIRRTDPLGRETHFQWDANGNLAAVIDALGGETRYGHDAENRLISQTDANGHVTGYEYDAEGRLTRITWPDGSSEQRQYDAAGRLILIERPGGSQVAIERDAAGQIIERHVDNGDDYQISYTASGMIATVNDALGQTEYLHDARDRLLAEILPDGSRVDYSYDGDGHLTGLSARLAGEEEADAVDYEHDALGRLITMIDATGSTWFDWDPVGNLERIEQPNGVVTDFEYDARDRIIQIRVHLSGTDLARHDYSYNLAGEPLSVVMHDGSRTDWVHDALGRLTRETRRDENGDVVFDQRYVFDAVGNRLERIDELTSLVEVYSYDSNDRLLSDGAGNYAYDADGQLIAASGPDQQRGYAWDAAGRLISFSDQLDPGQDRSYQYDHLDHRVAVTGAAGTVGHLNALINPTGWVQTVAEIGPGGQRQASLRYGVGLINQQRGGQTRFHHADRQGSHILLTDTGGLATDRYRYTAFGEIYSVEGSFANPMRFAGQRLDAERHQYYLRARHYDPRQARFISRDPFLGLESMPLSRHRYLYGHASPVMNSDPSGLLSLSNFAVSFATVGTLQKSYNGMLLKTFKEARSIGNDFLATGVMLRDYALSALLDSRLGGTDAERAFQTFQTSQMIIADSLDMVVAAGANNVKEFLTTWWLPTVSLKIRGLEWNLTGMATDVASGNKPSMLPSVSDLHPDIENAWKASKGIHDVLKAVKDGKDADIAAMNAVIGLLP